MTKPKRYPDNWQEIALSVKESALWRCTNCRQQCLRPGDGTKGLTKSERCALTLTSVRVKKKLKPFSSKT